MVQKMIRLQKLIYIFVLLSYSLSHAHPHIQSLQLFVPTRYDQQFVRNDYTVQKNRMQYQASVYYNTLLLSAQNFGHLNLRGIIGTGDSYTSQWNTAYSFIDQAPDEQYINMRQIFFEWGIKKWRWEIGVIPPVKGKVSNTSLDKDGWIRGSRVVMPVVQQSELELVSGAVDHLEDPNAFQLWDEWNYHELEWTHHWSTHWRSEMGYVLLDQQHYGRSELRWKWKVNPKVYLEIAGELLRNVSNSIWAFDVSALLKFSEISMVAEYSDVPDTFGLLGALSNDFFTLGRLGMLSLKGPLFKKIGLSWFSKSYLGVEQVRVTVGVGFRFQHDHERVIQAKHSRR